MPQYPPQYAQIVQGPPSSGLATASLVLGIVGLVFLCIPILGFVLAVLATTFGGVALSKARVQPIRNRGSAVAGMVMGLIVIAIAVLVVLFLGATGFLASMAAQTSGTPTY